MAAGTFAAASALSACTLVHLPATGESPAASSTAASSPSTGSLIPAPQPPPKPTASGAAVWVRPGEIPVGSCVDAADGIQYTTMSVVPCGDRHDAQVFAQLTLGKDIPHEDADEEDVDEWMDGLAERCEAPFAHFTGTEWDDSRLTLNVWVPTDEEIAAGHRAVTCLIEMYDQSRYSGSALGKNDEKQFGHAPGWRAPTDKELFSDEEEHQRA